MWNILKLLPIELVNKDVFSFLSLKSIALLERAACGRSSRPHLLHMISECLPFHLPRHQQKNLSFMYWFKRRNCKLQSFHLKLPVHRRNSELDLTVVESIELEIESDVSLEDISIINNVEIGNKILKLVITGTQNLEIMERIGQITPNVKKLYIEEFTNSNEWLTVDLIANWSIEEIYLCDTSIDTSVLVQLISMSSNLKLFRKNRGKCCSESVMRALVQHCPQLTTMSWCDDDDDDDDDDAGDDDHADLFTLQALLTLSDSTLPLEEVGIVPRIPDIPTADLPRCRHTLSKMQHLVTTQLFGRPDLPSFMSCFTELTYLTLDINDDNAYIPVIAQYCKKLRSIQITLTGNTTVENIVLLCSVNPELQKLNIFSKLDCTDDIIIGISQLCPHLRCIGLWQVITITDRTILAISEHCPMLEELDIGRSLLVTESAILQLCQRCERMRLLTVARQSLSVSAYKEIQNSRYVYIILR